MSYYHLVTLAKSNGWISKYVYRDTETWIKGDKTVTIAMKDYVPRSIIKLFTENSNV
jgi:hypothetical protein